MFARIGEHPASLLIVLLIIVILFGWKRLPDAARSVGRSMRIFKSEVSEMQKDGKTDAGASTVQGETLNAQQAAAAEARRKAAEARAAAERAEREAAEAERNANGSTRL